MVATRFLFAIPVLLALAIASTSPAPQTSPRGASPPTAAPPSPPSDCQPGAVVDDDARCTETLLWNEGEPAWHRDLRRTHAGGGPAGRRPPPGSLHGPI